MNVGFPGPRWVPTQPQPSGVAIGDLDGDGIADLVVDGETVFIGTGGGRFRPAAGSMAPKLRTPTLVDLDHDGKLDLIGYDGSVGVRLGHGDGTFGPLTEFALDGPGKTIAIADLDRDGNLDVVAPIAQDGHVAVLFGKGDGTFEAAVDYPTAPLSLEVAIADINGDGKLDIVVAGNWVSVLLGNGDRTFQPHVDYDLLIAASGIAALDLTFDGLIDIAIVADDYDRGDLSVLVGNGDGTFSRRDDLDGTRYAVWGAGADVDGDGNLDLVTVDELDDDVVVVFGGTAPRPNLRVQVGAFPASAAIGDIDGDGKPDLVVPNNEGANLSIALNDGHGGFHSSPPPAGPARFYFVADLNGDGKLDAVGGQPAGWYPGDLQKVNVQLGNGDTTFRAPVPYATHLAPQFVVPADVNHDGVLDILMLEAQSDQTGSLTVLFGNGDGTFRPEIDQPVPPGAIAFAVADLDGDGYPDVVEAYLHDRIRVQLGNGDGTFRAAVEYAMDVEFGPFAVADLNGDGKPDLAVIVLGTVRLMLGNGDGTFRPGPDTTSLSGYGPTAADVNGDGKLDLLLQVEPSFPPGNTVEVFLGGGDGSFTRRGSVVAGASLVSIDVADVTGDGKLDLVLYSPWTQTMTLLQGDGAGAFDTRIDYGAPGTGGIAVGDVTGDGRPDLLVSEGPIFIAACQP